MTFVVSTYGWPRTAQHMFSSLLRVGGSDLQLVYPEEPAVLQEGGWVGVGRHHGGGGLAAHAARRPGELHRHVGAVHFEHLGGQYTEYGQNK